MNLTHNMRYKFIIISRESIDTISVVDDFKLYPEIDNINILFFSLGMSWLSGRMLYRTPWSAMLDSVKASILGLGGVDCASFYPECNLEKERIKRRHRKKK